MPSVLSAFIHWIFRTGLESKQGRAGPGSKVQRSCISCSRSHSQEQRKEKGLQSTRRCPLPSCSKHAELALCQTWAGSMNLWPSWDLGKGAPKSWIFAWDEDLRAWMACNEGSEPKDKVCSEPGSVLAEREG